MHNATADIRTWGGIRQSFSINTLVVAGSCFANALPKGYLMATAKRVLFPAIRLAQPPRSRSGPRAAAAVDAAAASAGCALVLAEGCPS